MITSKIFSAEQWMSASDGTSVVTRLLPLLDCPGWPRAYSHHVPGDALAKTRRGQYVLKHMPPSAQALRLAGDALMGFGAYRRSFALVVAGAVVIAAGWAQAAWPRTSSRP